METTTIKDNLYKDIRFRGAGQPAIQIGAVWRGRGLKGALVDDLMVFDKELSALEALQIAQPETYKAILRKSPESLSEEEKNQLFAYFLGNNAKEYQAQLTKLTAARKKHAEEVEPIQEVMVMQDMEPKRPTYLLVRGEYSSHGEEVFPNTPSSVLKMPEDMEKNRLGLAKWLTDKSHPLTSRVAVNRLWLYFFGRGLVASAGDFGNQGEMPSHPQLLDWLSLSFMESGWDVKALQKMILMSATYRQSSHTSEELRETDPDNILLARGPSGRLPGEMIRDNALAASGLLVKEIGGRSVKPYQPEGLWKELAIRNATVYEPDSGSNLYRRGIYTIWKRSSPPPSMAIFDASDKYLCSVERQNTNTPLQALVLLNDPQYLEASRMLAERMLKEGGDRLDQQISYGFRLMTSRKPVEPELQLLEELYKTELKSFQNSPAAADSLLQVGEHPRDQSLPGDQLAAFTVVVSTLMNYDQAVYKR
jgi:hypothetical protein